MSRAPLPPPSLPRLLPVRPLRLFLPTQTPLALARSPYSALRSFFVAAVAWLTSASERTRPSEIGFILISLSQTHFGTVIVHVKNADRRRRSV